MAKLQMALLRDPGRLALYKHLLAEGFDTPNAVCRMTEEQMLQIGMRRMGTRAKMRLVQQQLLGVQQESQEQVVPCASEEGGGESESSSSSAESFSCAAGSSCDSF